MILQHDIQQCLNKENCIIIHRKTKQFELLYHVLLAVYLRCKMLKSACHVIHYYVTMKEICICSLFSGGCRGTNHIIAKYAKLLTSMNCSTVFKMKGLERLVKNSLKCNSYTTYSTTSLQTFLHFNKVCCIETTDAKNKTIPKRDLNAKHNSELLFSIL